MDEKKARALALDLMCKSPAAYLSTVDADGFPQIRAMLNLRSAGQYPSVTELFVGHERDMMIYISTNTSSEKVRQLGQNGRVAVYYCLPTEWRGLMLGGEIEFVDDPAIKKRIYQEGWEVYFPQGPSDPDYTVLRLSPTVARYYQNMDACEFKP
jgi:general stress protein 26